MVNLRSQSLRFAALTTSLYTREAWGLAGRGERVRSRALPVADAARRSIRSGRKNRASEQREDFFGHRKADGVGADFAPPQAETRQTGNAAGDR